MLPLAALAMVLGSISGPDTRQPPVYVASGDAAGRNSIAANLEFGFPLNSLWATYGITDQIDLGFRIASVGFATTEIGAILRAQIWHRERLFLSARAWGGWAFSDDPVTGQLLAADGLWNAGALLTVAGRREEGAFGLYLSLGLRVAFRPFVLCYSCHDAPDLVGGAGIGLRYLGMIGVELPVFKTFSFHIEAGAELRPNFPDGSIPIFPMPVLDGGLTWWL
jgi:hypothetical protein